MSSFIEIATAGLPKEAGEYWVWRPDWDRPMIAETWTAAPDAYNPVDRIAGFCHESCGIINVTHYAPIVPPPIPWSRN